MSKTTLEQAYISRDQILNQAEGASESSRVALSAITGRNILKTKEETAKIKRDEEIAAQNRAAQVTQALAQNAVDLGKSRLDYELRNQARDENRRQFQESLREEKRQTELSMAEQNRQFVRRLEQQDRQFWESLNEEKRQTRLTLAEQNRQFFARLNQQDRQFWGNLDEKRRQSLLSLDEEDRQFFARLNQQDRQFWESIGEKRRQSNLSLDERMRQFQASLNEDARQFDRNLDASIKAGQRSNIMAMLSVGVYHPSFAEFLGMSDGIIKEFAAKKAKEIEEIKAEKERIRKAQEDYNQSVKAIKDLQLKQKEAKSKEKWYEDRIKKTLKDNADSEEDADAAKEKVLKDSGVDEVKTGDDDYDVSANEGIKYLLYGSKGSSLDRAAASVRSGITGPSSVQINGKTVKVRKESNVASKEEKEKRIKTAKKVAETKDQVLAKQYKEMADYYDKQLTEAIRKKETSGKNLSALEENYKKKYGETTAYTVRSAEYDLNVAIDSGDAGEIDTAYRSFMDVFQKGMEKVGASARASYLSLNGKRENLLPFSTEDREDLAMQIGEVEGMISIIDHALSDFDFEVDLQDALQEDKEFFTSLLSALNHQGKYIEEYDADPDYFEKQREFLEMDEQYYAYSVEELEEFHAKEISTLKEELGQIEQRMGGYERGRLQYTDQYRADAERKKEIEALITDKNDDKKGLAGYIKTRKTNEKNDADYEAILMEARNAFGAASDAESISAYASSVRNETKEWKEYAAELEKFKEWSYDERLEYGKQLDYIVEEYDESGEVIGWGYRFGNGTVLPLTTKTNKEWLALYDDAHENIDARSAKERDITAAYHREVMNFAEEMIPADGLEEKAAKFSLEGFHEIAEQYKHGGKFFDGNYKDYESDVEGFTNGDYGFFEKEQAERVLALLAAGETELAFSYYANAREQALLAKAEDLHWAVAAGKGIASGLTKFLTQGGYMIENALTGSYERMAGTLGTASHQVTVERLDDMGFGGEALELLYMGGYTILDMVPAVAMGVAGNAVAPGLGSAVASGYIFAKSMATTYTEDIAAGKRADEALTHGILSGAAEVAMEKLLGSFPGITSENGLFTKLKDGLGRLATTKGAQTAIKYASSMGAEGFEEFMQEVISPFLSKVAADLNGIDDAELEEIDWEEAGRSFLLGAITGGAFSLAYAPFENRAMEIAAARTLQIGEVTELIDIGAQLENKTALKIKEAMQNQQPRYKGQEGMAAYVSEKDIANIQKSIRSRRVRGAAKTLSTMIEANMEGADPAEIKQAKAIFRKVLTAQTLTLEEASAIAKDERLLAVLEGMMGEQLLGKELSPKQVALLARLASFTDENGKVSKARLDLFKDAFGEFDTKAIEEMIRYDSMVGLLEDSVIRENESITANFNDAQREAVETLDVISNMTGFQFLITENHQTGDFLASGLMAVNPKELDQGIFYAVGHQAYQMGAQLYPEQMDSLRSMILEEAKKTLGEEGLEAEIQEILQQKALDGKDYSREMAEDEFCARYYPVMLTENAYTVDRTELASVRKKIEAFCNENRITEQERKIAKEMISEDQAEAPEAVAGTGTVRFEMGAEATTESQKQAVKLAKVLANAIGIDVVFYDSTIEGTYGANANGFFNEADSSIHLDLQKNLDDRKTIAFTMSHELTHFIKQWSVEKFDTFAKFLEEQYGEHGISMDELVKAKQEALGIEDPALAYEEVVCDACERMLLDSKAVEKLAALKQKDQSLFRRIINHIRSLLNKIRAEYSKNNYAPQSTEAKALQQMEGVLDKFYELFEDAALDAAANYQAAEGAVELEEKIKEQAKKNIIDLSEENELETLIKGISGTARKKLISEYILEALENQPIQLSDGRKAVVDKRDAHHIAQYAGAKKTAAISDIRKIVENAELRAHEKSTKEKKFDYFWYYEAYVKYGEEVFPIYVNVGNSRYDASLHVYDITQKIRDTAHRLDDVMRPVGYALANGVSDKNISQTTQNSQEKNNSIQKQRKISSLVAPGRSDVVMELAELYRQEGILQEARGLGGVDTDAFLENAYTGVDRLADTNIESAEMLRKVLGSIEQHFGESKVSGEIIAQLENKVKEHRAREYGWKNGGDQIRPGTDFNPESDAIDSLFTSEEVAAQNDGADFAKDFADMDPFEQAQFAADRQAEIDALFEMESEAARKADWKASEYMKAVSGAASMIAEEEAAPEAKVSTEVQEEKKNFGEKVRESWNWMQRKLVDSGDAVYDIGRREGDGHLYQYYNMARASSNAAISMIQNEQTDITGKNVGKGLNEIFNPIMKKGKAYYEQFQRYLFHMHNIDRMSRESLQAVEDARAEFDLIVECYPELTRYSERDIRRMAYDWSEPLQPAALEYTKALEHKEHMENIRNIPVFGYDVTAEISEGEVQKYLREHPEFKELAEGVYRYLDNLMQYRVDSGLVSKDLADQLKTIYPHYVPTMRVQGEIEEGISFQKDNRTAIGKTVGRAEGGEAILVPLHKQIADQTLSVVREGSKNRFGTRLLKLAQQKELAEVLQIEKASDRMLGITDFEGAIDKADPFQQEEWESLFMVYDQGVQYVLSVKPELMEAVKALSPDRDVMTEAQKIGKKTVDLYKKLITSYNPAFAVRNFVRDIQDATLYSKDLKRFILNYLPAWKEITGNGEYWRQYQALGGTYSSIFDYNQGRIKEPGNWIKEKVSNRIEWLNMAVEQAPRLAEFMATVKKGDGSMDNLMEAMYNAADITTNFGRSGTKGKIWNRSYVPFLNPSIQGWSKACRMLTETKGFKPWAMLITKAAVLGYVIPALFNGIFYGDDDEYELIKQRDKDINYLFKIKDGLWLKVPKGRVLSVIGMAGDRIHQMIDGEEVGWGEFISTAADQIAPVNPLTSNVAAGFVDALDNKNWYGGDIVPQSMQDDPAEEQYDATTDVISIALGKALKISPKKINYILDSYTGVVGDIVLPALSVASQQNFISKAFLIDTDYSNRLQGNFYDTLNELAVNKNSSKATAADEVKYRWWNYKAKAVSEIGKEIKRIQGDASLNKKEKEEALQVQYAARNALLLQSEEEYDRYIKAVDERFDKNHSANAEEIYREVNREIYGAEMALQIEGKSTYERAQKVVKEHGIDFETFYDIHFDSSVDTDKAAEMIGEGFEKDSAITLAREFEALEPEAGAESVSYMQKYKAIAGADVDESEKLFAMSLYASDSDRRRIAIGTEHDVSLDQFIAVKESLEIANGAAGKSGASNARIRAAIASTDGLTLRQQAILWQLFTSSTSAKNNPFSVSIGWETVAQIEAYKAAREEE